MLKGDGLVGKAIEYVFTLFWKVVALPAKKALSCF